MLQPGAQYPAFPVLLKRQESRHPWYDLPNDTDLKGTISILLQENHKFMSQSVAKKRIFLIDDEAPVVNALQKFLEKQGYDITIESSSIEALRILETDSDSYDLIITDLTMPEMNGVELARKVHDLNPDLPVMVMTGYGANLPQEELTIGIISKVIAKPFKIANLTAAMQSLLDP